MNGRVQRSFTSWSVKALGESLKQGDKVFVGTIIQSSLMGEADGATCPSKDDLLGMEGANT